MKKLFMVGLMCLSLMAEQYTFAQNDQEPKSQSSPSLAETLEFIKGKLPSLDEDMPVSSITDWTTWKPIFAHKDSTDKNRHFYAMGYKSFEFEGSVLKILVQYRVYKTTERQRDIIPTTFLGGCDESTQIQLSQIDPSSIKSGRSSDYGFYWVRMRTTGDRKSMDWRKFNCQGFQNSYLTIPPYILKDAYTEKDTRSSISEFIFLVLSEESANKITKALVHAVKLSGGKEEPF